MGSPSFGLFGNNGAPLPPVFAGTNPTGGHSGGGITPGGTFPNFGLFSNPMTRGSVSPTANAPVFSGTSGGMQNLSSGFGNSEGPVWKSLYKEITNAYGPGAGDYLFNLLKNGEFNPQVAASFLNAMQPGINRGEGNILNAFGAEGSRFGSAAALGLGDFQSQVNLNEQQTLASMYMQAQHDQLGLMEGILPTLHQEQADKGGGLWHDILGGLEIAGGVAMEFVPGLQVPGAALIGGGVGTLAGGLDHGSGGSSSGGNTGPSGSSITSLLNMFKNSPTPSSNPMEIPSISNNTFWDTYSRDALTASAGDSIFAA